MGGKIFQKMKISKDFQCFQYVFPGFFSFSAVLIEHILKRIVEMLLSQNSMRVISFLHNEFLIAKV